MFNVNGGNEVLRVLFCFSFFLAKALWKFKFLLLINKLMFSLCKHFKKAGAKISNSVSQNSRLRLEAPLGSSGPTPAQAVSPRAHYLEPIQHRVHRIDRTQFSIVIYLNIT